jgi:hypothetical protein
MSEIASSRIELAGQTREQFPLGRCYGFAVRIFEGLKGGGFPGGIIRGRQTTRPTARRG